MESPEKVDVNRASAEELETALFGIGRKRARAIVRRREELKGFSSLDDLLHIKGITGHLLERNCELLLCHTSKPSTDTSTQGLSSSSNSSFSDGALDEEGGVHDGWEEGENEEMDEREQEDLSDTVEGIEDDCGESYYYFVADKEWIDLVQEAQGRHLVQRVKPKMKRKSENGLDVRALSPGKKLCKGSEYSSFTVSAISVLQLALYVLSFLEPRDLLRAAQTCRYWRILAEDNLLWREKCREEVIEEPLYLRRRRMLSTGFMYSPWKSAFMRQHKIDTNWRSGEIKPPKVLKGHDDHVITCLQFSGNRILSGSDDNTLKVWSAITGECVQTLVGHTGGVWSSQMRGNIVISGSTDRTLKVWNAETGECIHTLYGHASTVRCMHLHGNKVVSGSRDATLRVWDIDTGRCLHTLLGHVAAVRCVQYDGKRVVSGAYDYTVKVWDPETEACVHTLQGHTNRVYSLQYDGVHIVSGSLDTSIRVWDAENGNCLHTLMGHQSLTSGMELKDNILVSGNADSTVKIWDIKTGQCLQTLQGPNKHQSAVTCLQFIQKFVVTSSDDGTVKLWDLKTGEFIRNLVALESGGSGGVVWRLRASKTKLICAVGSRNGTEETKLLVLDFDVDMK
ncbi:F-box/WD repeat-containing protein 7-like [Rhincodon typus]|uniref:F-box/WD repeat-containing protein 7-like n=1 Tax=Rhincodon typus TaxID=259920 RepID=UPI00202DDB1E|nr:F-box/WD repeat-containing protein 7-like [Rhincodon typus]